MRRSVLFPLILLCISLGTVHSYGQVWSGMLSPSRAIDWSGAGVEGGIPSGTWAQCGSTIAAYSGAATSINNAIAACPANHYVQLGAGTFNLSSGINMLSNVELRGMGANQTFLIFTGSISCNGANPGICFMGDNVYYGGANVQPGGSNAALWTAGYSAGATSITLSNVGSVGIKNGSYIYLDQANDTSIGATQFVCDVTTPACSLEGGGLGRTIGGVNRGQVQIVKVVSGCATSCAGAGPFTLTISPGLYASDWRAGQNPGAWFASGMVTNAGVQNLSMDTSAIADPSNDLKGMQFDNAANCWAKGIRSIRNPTRRSHIEMQNSAHISIVDNYFYGNAAGSSVQYGVESLISSDNLVQNNIFHSTGPIMMGPASGTVVGYNFVVNQPTNPITWNSAMIWEHDAGVQYVLAEGNTGPGFTADTYHGNSMFNTLFRNRFTGQDTGKTNNTTAIELWAYNRYHNIIGNVLGQPGYTTTYTSDPGGNGSQATIYAFGDGDGVGTDKSVGSTVMRWGNYDTVNNAVRFVSSEVPSGIGSFANTLPTSQTLPASLYLSAKPSWWSFPSGNTATPWPAIGPDVTGGSSSVGGHAYLTPAASCFAKVMGGATDGTSGLLPFNASNCYTATSISQPLAPTGVSAVPR